MISEEYSRFSELMHRDIPRGMEVNYCSPKSDDEAERWGDYKVALIYQASYKNSLRNDR